MIAADYVVFALSTLMWNEPKDGGLQLQTACGLVVRNRVLAGWEGQDWLKVITNHDKSSAWPDRKRSLEWGDPVRDDKFRRCLAIANSIYEGREKDITYGALRYCQLNDVCDEFRDKIIRPTTVVSGGAVELVHKRVASIAQYQFFK